MTRTSGGARAKVIEIRLPRKRRVGHGERGKKMVKAAAVVPEIRVGR